MTAITPEAKAESEGLTRDFRTDPDRLRVKACLYIAAKLDRFPGLANVSS